MWFGRQQREALISTAGWRLQGHWQAGNTLLTPYAEVAWNHDSRADAREVTAGLNSMNGQFALTGLSDGLRAELAGENILVTTVCPGLMRTG